jgi:hypothetical protein
VTAYAASGKRDAVAPAILFLASLAAYASLAL